MKITTEAEYREALAEVDMLIGRELTDDEVMRLAGLGDAIAVYEVRYHKDET